MISTYFLLRDALKRMLLSASIRSFISTSRKPAETQVAERFLYFVTMRTCVSFRANV